VENSDAPKIAPVENDEREEWITPTIASFAPVKAAEGISYLPGDGQSNLTP
jgi:hypothetical protein